MGFVVRVLASRLGDSIHSIWDKHTIIWGIIVTKHKYWVCAYAQDTTEEKKFEQ